jgi:hypothetical protein
VERSAVSFSGAHAGFLALVISSVPCGTIPVAYGYPGLNPGLHSDVPSGLIRRLIPSVVEVLTPFVVGVADHAHDVAASVQRKGARLAQELDVVKLAE